MRGILPALEQVIHSRHSLETHQWQLTLTSEDSHNRVYHCHPLDIRQHDLAAKVLPHNAERRAWHEYAAMRVLWHQGIQHASPEPLFLIDHRPDQPYDFVITGWVEGQAFTVSPDGMNKLAWTTILNALAEVHRLSPETVAVKIPNSIQNIRHPADVIKRLQYAASNRPSVAKDDPFNRHRQIIQQAIALAQANLPHYWSNDVPLALIHGDWNITNFIYEEGAVRFVDWEMSGWSDPAIDIATLIAHPSLHVMSEDDKSWLINQYGDLVQDRSLSQRVNVYSELFDIYWLIHTVGCFEGHDHAGSSTLTQTLETMQIYESRIMRRYNLDEID